MFPRPGPKEVGPYAEYPAEEDVGAGEAKGRADAIDMMMFAVEYGGLVSLVYGSGEIMLEVSGKRKGRCAWRKQVPLRLVCGPQVVCLKSGMAVARDFLCSVCIVKRKKDARRDDNLKRYRE